MTNKEFTQVELNAANSLEFILNESSPSLHKEIKYAVHAAHILGKEDSKCADAVVEAVRQDLLNRSHVGIVKYGTTLYDNMGDLRYWLQHSYEETLDKANYLKRAIMEIDRIADDNK